MTREQALLCQNFFAIPQQGLPAPSCAARIAANAPRHTPGVCWKVLKKHIGTWKEKKPKDTNFNLTITLKRTSLESVDEFSLPLRTPSWNFLLPEIKIIHLLKSTCSSLNSNPESGKRGGARYPQRFGHPETRRETLPKAVIASARENQTQNKGNLVA